MTSRFLFFTPEDETLTRDAGAKLVRELGQQVVVDSVFGRPQDDDGTGVVHYRQTDRNLYSYLFMLTNTQSPGRHKD